MAPTSHNRRLSCELAQVRGIVDEIITEPPIRAPKESVEDMLGRLLAARDAQNAADRLSETEVTNQVLLFLIAGRETTAMTLACTLPQLALTPQWQTKLRAEIAERLHGRMPRAEEVGQLERTGRFVHESMRLYPGAYGMNRSTRDAEVLGWLPHPGWIVGRGVGVGDPPFRGRVARA